MKQYCEENQVQESASNWLEKLGLGYVDDDKQEENLIENLVFIELDHENS